MVLKAVEENVIRGVRLNVGKGPSHTDYRQIVIRRSSHIGSVDGFTGFEANLDPLRALDDMEISHHMSVLIPKKARTSTLTDLPSSEKSSRFTYRWSTTRRKR